MRLLLKHIALLALLVSLSQHYTLTVTVDNPIINVLATYTFVFSFADSTVRNVTLNFPDTSDLSSTSLAVYINNNAGAMATGLYTVDQSLKKITINSLTPSSNTLTIKISNVKNPPSAIQFSFITGMVPTQALTIATPYINYNAGTLLSCGWLYDKFTGSTNSIVDITIVLGNKLLAGNNQIQVQFPNLYEDSDSQYLTLNSIPVITYSIDNGITYLNPLSSPSTFISNTRINFWLTLSTELPGSSTFKIKLTGIVNPPTTNPSGKFFIVSTNDLNGRMIDRISQCTISPVSVLQITGVFDQTTLYVGDLYTNPKIIVNSIIPFTIFQNDIMQMDHVDSLLITNSTPLQITLTRGSPFVSFYLDTSQSSTSTSTYFKGNIDNYNSGDAYSEVQFKFSINAPNSQKPWDFSFWLKRPSGAYVKINAILQAYAIAVNSAKVTITPASTQMSLQSQYTLNLELERPISKSGKILLGFNPDYAISAGACVGYNGLSQITSTSSCELVIKNGLSWLMFKINDTISSIIPSTTVIKIIYSSGSIRNPLYPNTYTFRLQVYYNELDDSLVEQAAILGNVQMTRHYSFKGSLLTNDFTVYSLATVTISYINDVYIPTNTALQFILPNAVYSFDFIGNISINAVNVTNATFDKSFAGGKTGQVTIKQDISPGTVWLIPIVVRMPYIVGDYPSITFKLMNATVVYEQVDSGLIIRVKYPSTDLTALIQPKSNTLIDASTDYLVKIQSRVPLPATFYLILTSPPEITIGTTLACVSSIGACSSILKPSPTMLNLTQINSPYTLSDSFQQFTFTVNSFTNPRYQGSSSAWTVQLKGLYNGGVADISGTTAISSSFVHSTGVVCQLDPTKNYYKGNTDAVVLSCAFSNNLIQGDFIEIVFTSNSYTLNTTAVFSCTSPSLSLVSCINAYSSATTLKLKVSILTTFISNKNQLTLQISGLISSPDTTYLTPPSAISVSRYDLSSRLIDTGVFYYDINCNQNSTIIGKTCKTCSNSLCTSCYLFMFLSGNGTCVRDCTIDTQFKALNNVNTSQCEPCMSPCYTCENSSSTCLSCIVNTYLYTSTHTCQPICDTSSLYWINTVSYPGQMICDLCLSQCRVCYNSSYNGCIQCQTAYVLENGVCRSGCLNPTSYIYNGVCIPCDPACSTCTNAGANNCVQCKQLYYINNGYCVAQCPSNKYPLSNGTCGCQGSCSTCTSSSPTYCMSCLDPTNFIYNGSCLLSCPLYTYMLVNQCIECPKNCIQCTTSTTCNKCAPSFYIYQSGCYFDCNTISYQYDVKGNSCVLCPTGCDTCADTVCYTCLEGYTRNQTECIKACILTNTCAVQSPVPSTVTPLPATIVFFVWVIVVIVAKFFNPKLYPPYAIVFLTAVIELCLIMGTAIYAGGLMSGTVKRLLVLDVSQRPIILNLLIASLALNYVMNIVYAIIFWKYIYPLVKDPRQVDYITIGVVFVIGMLTNYRFNLLCFSKMFPKPYIHVEFASRLTPIHYMCIASVLLSGLTLGAAGLILKNQYPLTDLFMLGVDILIIQVLLILLSIWLVAVKKDESYFESDIKKYHLEENQRTEGNVFDDKDQKNMSKHQLQIRDDFTLTEGNLPEDNLRDSTNYKRLLSKTSMLNPTTINQASDLQPPLEKFSQTTKINVQRSKPGNKIENSFDSGVSLFDKTKKGKKPQSDNNQNLKSKIKEIDSERKKTDNVFDTSGKKFETEDESQMPKALERKESDNMLVDINEPSSDDIPNLPLTSTIFHERASSEFGQRIKPTKITSKANQRSQTTIKNKSPSKSPSKSPMKSGKNMRPADIISKTEVRPNMKKKNKFFESEAEAQMKKDMNDVDIESIIKNRIVVIEHNDKGEEHKFANTTLGDPNNISSISKKDEENSDFNEEVSPSWFNIQNQRFDLSQMGSEMSDN